MAFFGCGKMWGKRRSEVVRFGTFSIRVQTGKIVSIAPHGEAAVCV